MIDFEKIESLVKEISTLNNIEKNKLLTDLLKAGALSFVEVSEEYVLWLQAERHKHLTAGTMLALMLGMYCEKDKTAKGKTARQHLYESGYYTEKDGSGFGEQLEKEFKPQ